MQKVQAKKRGGPGAGPPAAPDQDLWPHGDEGLWAVPSRDRVVERFGKIPVVVIDPGHGGADPGATIKTSDGLLKEVLPAWAISAAIGALLQSVGVTVYFSRHMQSGSKLFARTAFANRLKADLFLSIHCDNFAPCPSEDRAGALHHPRSRQGARLALGIATELETFTRSYTRARGNLAVLRRTVMPAVLVECGFLCFKDDSGHPLVRGDRQTAVAGAVARGVLDWLQKETAHD